MVFTVRQKSDLNNYGKIEEELRELMSDISFLVTFVDKIVGKKLDQVSSYLRKFKKRTRYENELCGR